MAIANAKKRKIGNELIDWVFLGVRTGMRRGVAEYRTLATTGRTAQAETAIKRAVDLPHRARVRVQTFISAYNARFGSGAVAFVADCLSLTGSGVTLAEIDADLTAQETYAAGLVAARNGGATWDQIASDIETNVQLEQTEWAFPFPVDYTDVWGE